MTVFFPNFSHKLCWSVHIEQKVCFSFVMYEELGKQNSRSHFAQSSTLIGKPLVKTTWTNFMCQNTDDDGSLSAYGRRDPANPLFVSAGLLSTEADYADVFNLFPQTSLQLHSEFRESPEKHFYDDSHIICIVSSKPPLLMTDSFKL